MALRSPGYDDVQPVRDLVTDEEVADAFAFLARTHDDIAELQSDRDYFEYMIGAAEAVAANFSSETSVDRRKWDARTSSQYLKQLEQWRQCARQFLALKAKRDAAALKIDVWRTIQANKRGTDAWPGQQASGPSRNRRTQR